MLSSNQKTRTCIKHGEQLLSAYYVSKTNGDNPRTIYKCKACDKNKTRKHRKNNPEWWREYGRKWRSRNKKKTRKYLLENKKKNMSYVLSYLQTHACVDCGEKDPVVLEFDHVRGQKHKNISVMVQSRYSLQKIKEEIEKCEVRCANCHKRKTATQFKYYKYLSIKDVDMVS